MSASGGSFVLIVEDEEEARSALVTGLAAHGYSAAGVRTVGAAKRILGKVRPDAIVLDLGLPDEPGEKLLEQVRAQGDPRLLGVPVVVVSGKSNARELAKSADAVFVKPIRLDEVLAALVGIRDRSRAAIG